MSLFFLHPLITEVRSVPEAMQNTAADWVSKAEKLGKWGKEPKKVKAKGSPKQQASFRTRQASRMG